MILEHAVRPSARVEQSRNPLEGERSFPQAADKVGNDSYPQRAAKIQPDSSDRKRKDRGLSRRVGGLAALFLVVSILLAVGGGLLLTGWGAGLAENMIADYPWDWSTISADQATVIAEADAQSRIDSTLKARDAGVIRAAVLHFRPNNLVQLFATLGDFDLRLDVRLSVVDGIPQIQIETIDDISPIIVGDVLSSAANPAVCSAHLKRDRCASSASKRKIANSASFRW